MILVLSLLLEMLVLLVQNRDAGDFGGRAIETDGDLRALSLSTPICRQPARQKRGNTTCGQKMKKVKK